MKMTFAAVGLLVSLSGVLGAGAVVDVPVTVSDLRRYGVRLTSPLSDDFDSLARPLIGRRADRLLGLKPLLAAITNDTRKTIAAASVVFRVKRPVGGFDGWTNIAFPEVVIGDLQSGDRLGVQPGESTVVAQSLAVEHFDGPEPEDSYRSIIDWVLLDRDEVLAGAEQVAIELDAVIFDDGTIIGPDQDNKLASLFTGRVAAYQHWLQLVADGLAAGHSVEGAFQSIRTFQEEVRAAMGKIDRRPPTMTEVDRTNAAADVMKWRRATGDGEMPARLARLRLSPFKVSR